MLIKLDELDRISPEWDDPEGDDAEIHPSAWRAELPMDPDEFWTGGTTPEPRDGRAPAGDAAILRRLGSLNAWSGHTLRT